MLAFQRASAGKERRAAATSAARHFVLKLSQPKHGLQLLREEGGCETCDCDVEAHFRMSPTWHPSLQVALRYHEGPSLYSHALTCGVPLFIRLSSAGDSGDHPATLPALAQRTA
jgi:hypothetical protein